MTTSDPLLPAPVPRRSILSRARAFALPLVAAAAVFGASYGIFHELREHEGRLMYRIVGADTQRLGQRVKEQLLERLGAVQRLADQWAANPSATDTTRLADVSRLLFEDLDFRGVEWRDTTFAVRFAGPLDALLPKGALDPGDDAVRHDELMGVAGEGAGTIARTYVGPSSGQRQILFYAPMQGPRGPVGSVVAVARARDVFDSIFEDRLVAGYVVSVYEGFYQVYGPTWTDGGDEVAWMNETDALVGQLGIKIQMWPSTQLVSQLQSFAPRLVLIWGGVLALLTGALVYGLRRRDGGGDPAATAAAAPEPAPDANGTPDSEALTGETVPS